MLRTCFAGLLLVIALDAAAASHPTTERRWLAGDHHVHSIYSAKYPTDPERPEIMPESVIGGDSSHTILQNAQMARRFGLDWMVSTDHGGPHHSALNYTKAWPDVVVARRAVPDLLLFYGMEFDVPGGEHATLILPLDIDERDTLREIESRFGKREAFPPDPARNTKPRMMEALRYMARLPNPPVLIANHPSRTAPGRRQWGLHTPQEFHQWHQTAPHVAIGMEGAPGHQAAKPKQGLDAAHGSRGLYGGYPTMGGFDQMVATLGGAWDTLLGQGLHWTITATSDSHGHWSEGGADFWPGEYAKTWVFAKPSYSGILEGLRAGRVFVATGGLIDRLDFLAGTTGRQEMTVSMGDTLMLSRRQTAEITIRFRSATAGAGGKVPAVHHVDLIIGSTLGEARAEGQGERNESAVVAKRFTASDWRQDGEMQVIRHRLKLPAGVRYIRLRGTNTTQAEPEPDRAGEDPWQDLWFYSNPIYVQGDR
ncbi:phosphoesterase [Novosphingobium sp. RD2P27]|uniref:Phosphoesterase n=1 Tax=Novosphingobium kalidii TaxID=3230299 RepID=A0ABV2D2U9_9SPHN